MLKQCIVSFLVAIHWEKNCFSPSCVPAQWTHILWCCPILGQTSHIWSIMLTLSGSRSWEVFRSLPLPLPGPTIMFFYRDSNGTSQTFWQWSSSSKIPKGTFDCSHASQSFWLQGVVMVCKMFGPKQLARTALWRFECVGIFLEALYLMESYFVGHRKTGSYNWVQGCLIFVWISTHCF